MCISFTHPKPQFELFVSTCTRCKFISFVLENLHKIECVGTKDKMANMMETQDIYNNPCVQSMILSVRTPEGAIQNWTHVVFALLFFYTSSSDQFGLVWFGDHTQRHVLFSPGETDESVASRVHHVQNSQSLEDHVSLILARSPQRRCHQPSRSRSFRLFGCVCLKNGDDHFPYSVLHVHNWRTLGGIP